MRDWNKTVEQMFLWQFVRWFGTVNKCKYLPGWIPNWILDKYCVVDCYYGENMGFNIN